MTGHLSNSIPNMLKRSNQWLCHDENKKPISAVTGHSFNWQNNLSDFQTAMNYANLHGLGLGFAFNNQHEFFGVDLDGCVCPQTGAIEPWALAILEQLPSYREVSLSGTGIKVICRGHLPFHLSTVGFGEAKFGKPQQVEFKTVSGYFALTGIPVHSLPKYAINEIDCLACYQFVSPNFEMPTQEFHDRRDIAIFSDVIERKADEEIYSQAVTAANGQKFLDLWNGNWQKHFASQSQSEADLALLNILAFYSRNREQVKRMFLQSALGQREKAKRPDYLDRSLEKAITFIATSEQRQNELIRGMIAERATNSTTSANYEINEFNSSSNSYNSWPVLAEPAYHGIAGEFVKFVEPHTEGDPAAILLQLLIAFGCYFGRLPHFLAESTPHYANLFGVIVGDTSKARKGTSWGWVNKLFQLIDLNWSDNNVRSGLVSGEGLIYHVRDEGIIAKKNGVADPGVSDKRMLIQEDEFSSVLKVIAREKNTLSDTMRKAWDGKSKLSTLAKNEPITATNAHVSVIGHITETELRQSLNTTECFNGFGNRFLWCCARRSKELALGSQVIDLYPIAERFNVAFQNGFHNFGTVNRTEAADQLWVSIYSQLSKPGTGLYGAMIARSEAQVMRLALIYAILDSSSSIDTVHLRAALAVWNYSSQSCEYLFGNSTGNKNADQILQWVKGSGIEGLGRTEISRRFNGNRKASDINIAVEILKTGGLIVEQRIKNSNDKYEVRYFDATIHRNQTHNCRKSPPRLWFDPTAVSPWQGRR